MSGFARARSLSEAVELMAEHAHEGATVLAGGTDFMVERQLAPNPWSPKDGVPGAGPEARWVVDISSVHELSEVSTLTGDDGNEWMTLGAGVTYWSLRTHPLIVSKVPMLGRMAADVGAVQIQARGTLGGNLATASPAGDGVPVLVALGAVIRLASVSGERDIPVETFYTGYKRTLRLPTEIIRSVMFPVPGVTAKCFWRKVGTRRAQSISKVALASVIETEENVVSVARLAMASVGPTVALLPRVRSELMGKKLTEINLSRVTDALRADIRPIDDVRSTGAYRLHVAERVLRRMLRA